MSKPLVPNCFVIKGILWYLRGTLNYGFVFKTTYLFVRVNPHSTTYLHVYIDDIILIASNDYKVPFLITTLSSKFILKYLILLSYFLGIEVVTLPNGDVMMNHRNYIKELLAKTHMEHSYPSSTLMTTSHTLSTHTIELFDNPTYYRSVVGTLQYINITRLNLTYDVNNVCYFMSKPLVPLCLVVKRILPYLRSTLNFGFVFKPSSQFPLHGFVDVD